APTGAGSANPGVLLPPAGVLKAGRQCALHVGLVAVVRASRPARSGRWRPLRPWASGGERGEDHAGPVFYAPVGEGGVDAANAGQGQKLGLEEILIMGKVRRDDLDQEVAGSGGDIAL